MPPGMHLKPPRTALKLTLLTYTSITLWLLSLTAILLTAFHLLHKYLP